METHPKNPDTFFQQLTSETLLFKLIILFNDFYINQLDSIMYNGN